MLTTNKIKDVYERLMSLLMSMMALKTVIMKYRSHFGITFFKFYIFVSNQTTKESFLTSLLTHIAFNDIKLKISHELMVLEDNSIMRPHSHDKRYLGY